jgi:thiol-disulfide isomerase/thioredoxin
MKRLVLLLVLAVSLASATPPNEDAAWETLLDEAAGLTADLPEDEDAGKKILAERLEAQLAGFRKFLADYPQSANRWEARMAVMQIGNSLDMIRDREPDMSAQSAELQSIADDPDAPTNIRADAGLVLLQMTSMEFDRQRTEASARTLNQAIDKFIETHPDDARAPILRLTQAQALEVYDPEEATKLYSEFTASDDPDIVEAARKSLELMEMRTKPLELSFTAVDGRQVDLADLRGKVGLLDFWATWCPPCLEEAPALAAVYEKYHNQGFEIIGISLDQNQAALENFTKDNNMPWPQFFDGQGWDNELAKRFKIQSVPTVWLLDREGKLIDASPRGRLEQSVSAALATP